MSGLARSNGSGPSPASPDNVYQQQQQQQHHHPHPGYGVGPYIHPHHQPHHQWPVPVPLPASASPATYTSAPASPAGTNPNSPKRSSTSVKGAGGGGVKKRGRNSEGGGGAGNQVSGGGDGAEDEDGAMGGTTGAGEGGKAGRVKRVKVGARASIACGTCRRRKVRCSGDYPVCSFCSNRGTECVYDGHPAAAMGMSNKDGVMVDSPVSMTISPTLQKAAVPVHHALPSLPPKEILLQTLDSFHQNYHETGLFTFFHRQMLEDGLRRDKGLGYGAGYGKIWPNWKPGPNYGGGGGRRSSAGGRAGVGEDAVMEQREREKVEVWFAILTLSARFCEPVYAQHGSPLAASSHYAQILNSILQSSPDTISLTRVQVYLMLALHEFTEGQEDKGWLDLGKAIRLGQCLKVGSPDPDEFEYEPHEPGSGIDGSSVDPSGFGSLQGLSTTTKTSSVRGSMTTTSSSSDFLTPAPTPLTTTTSPNQSQQQGTATATIAPSPQDVILSEIRRRTFWSLFLLERLLCDGKDHSTMIDADTLQRALPMSDMEFHEGKRLRAPKRFDESRPDWVKTEKERLRDLEDGSSMGMGIGRDPNLDPSIVGYGDPSSNRTSRNSGSGMRGGGGDIEEVDLYGPTLRIAETWSLIINYIGAGGRNSDRRAPWFNESTFWKLDKRLRDWQNGLTDHLMKFDLGNLQKVCFVGQGRLYGLMHLLYFNSQLWLHRDYLPFCPQPERNPQYGPVDGEPLLQPMIDRSSIPNPTAPDGFWLQSTLTAFEAAHKITESFDELEKQGAGIRHPYAGFAVLSAATMHLYLYVLRRVFPGLGGDVDVVEKLRRDTAILDSFQQFWTNAKHWCVSVNSMYELYTLPFEGGFNASSSHPLSKIRNGVMIPFHGENDDDSNEDQDEDGSMNHPDVGNLDGHGFGQRIGNVSDVRASASPDFGRPHSMRRSSSAARKKTDLFSLLHPDPKPNLPVPYRPSEPQAMGKSNVESPSDFQHIGDSSSGFVPGNSNGAPMSSLEMFATEAIANQDNTSTSAVGLPIMIHDEGTLSSNWNWGAVANLFVEGNANAGIDNPPNWNSLPTVSGNLDWFSFLSELGSIG